MNSRHKPIFGAILLLLGIVSPALAAELNADTELSPDPGEAIQAGLGILFGLDSNIYNTNANQLDSWIGVLTPAILFSTPPDARRYALLYEGEYAHFFADSANNYDDHVLSGVARFQLGSRGQFDLAAATEKGHRGRGSDQTGGLDPSSPSFPSAPDRFDHNKWRAKFRYGADGNRGRLRFDFGADQRQFTNNRERTKPFDYSAQSGGVGLSLLFHQRTAVVVDAVFTDIRYDSTPPGEVSRDSNDWRYLLGLTWAATAKTTGSVRLGVQQRSFDDPAVPNTSNPTWEVDVRWSPREHSHLDFVTSRVNQESFAEGAFIDSIVSNVAWTHEWSRGWQSIVKWTQSEFDFVDSARNQDLREFYLGLRYPQGRLLTWEAGYEWRSRDSSLDRYVYDGNMFTIGVNFSR